MTFYEAAPSQASLSCPTVRSPNLGRGEKLIPWGDQPPHPCRSPLPNVAKGLTRRGDLGSWITPSDNSFSIAHYNRPEIVPKTWRLDVGRPASLEIASHGPVIRCGTETPKKPIRPTCSLHYALSRPS